MTDAGVVRVRRSGGFSGHLLEGSLDLTGPDERVPEARRLLASVDLSAIPREDIYPDAFVFWFEVDGISATVPDYRLTPALRRLVELVLDDPWRGP